jgi:tetratricopeptide (TPR) repeat protein
LTRAAATAWRYPHSNEEVQAWQDLLSNEGYALLMGGDIVRSTDAYTAAFQWARQHKELADVVLVLENILKPLGNNYTRLGDYEQALFIQGKALAIAGSLEDKEALAGVYSNLANTSSNMGLPGQSREYCRQGLAVADPHAALSGLLLSEQADACEQLRQDKAARASILKSISVLEHSTTGKKAGPDAGYWLLMAYQQAGDIYSEDPGLALQFYTKALTWQNRLWQQHGAIRKRERAKLFQRLGALCLRVGQPDRAGYWLDQCLSVLIPGKKADSLRESDLFAENTLMDLLFTLGDLSLSQKHTDEALHLYTLCFATEKKLRHELISGSSKERSVSDSRLRYEKAIRTAWDGWESTGQKKYQQRILEFMESSKSQLLLEEVLQQPSYPRSFPLPADSPVSAASPGDSLQNRIRLLERALVYYRKEALQTGASDSLTHLKAMQEKQTEWDLAELRKKAGAPPVIPDPGPAVTGAAAVSGTTDVSSFLKEGQVTRSFFAGATALYTVEYSRSGISFTEKLPLDRQGQDSIRAFIHTYFEEGANAMINRPGDYYRQAYSIYRQLFGSHPLLPGKAYILLPDGALSLLPFEALVTTPSSPPSPEKWSFVIRQSLISYAWSLRTLQQQVLTQGNGKGAAGFFLSGNQDHGKSPLLTSVLKEKAAMAAILGEGTYCVDEQATTAAFRKALQASALVHISSHAFTKKDTLDAPHIQLFDEPFYLFELKGLDRHPALVVLSACRTGDGRMVTGEGVQSLARAFSAGGANAVIAGWWNVNDEAAAQLMQGFYTALSSGPNAAMALRQSKLNWLDAPGISYLHKLPYYWAALNYQGNPLPLSAGNSIGNGRAKNFGWWWMLLALPVLGLFIPALLRRRRNR